MGIARRLESLRREAKFRPPGYLEDLLGAGSVSKAGWVLLSVADYTRLELKYPTSMASADWPGWARVIRLVKTDADRGVGDTISRVIGPIGGEAYKVWFLATFQRPCGCTERQADLNAKFLYLSA